MPTWQTRAGGSADSSRYIVYSDVPGGVLSTHGSSRSPWPCALAIEASLIGATLRALAEGPRDGVGGCAHSELGFQVRKPVANGVEAEKELPSDLGLVIDDGGRT